MKISKLLTVRNFVYLVLAVLAVTLYFQCQGNKAKKAEITELQPYKTKYDNLKKAVDSMVIETSISHDADPVGVVIREGDGAQSRTLFLTDWKQVEKEREAVRKLSNQLNEAVRANDSITLKYFQLLGGSTINWVDFTEELPEVKTTKKRNGKNFDATIEITSHGDLIDYKDTITVTPEVIVITETKTEKVKANNIITLTGGMVYFKDQDFHNYTIGGGYGWKWVYVDGGVLLAPDGFKYNGFQGKAGVVFKF